MAMNSYDRTNCKLSKHSFFGQPKIWVPHGDQESKLGEIVMKLPTQAKPIMRMSVQQELSKA